jgi:hypothetical protein
MELKMRGSDQERDCCCCWAFGTAFKQVYITLIITRKQCCRSLKLWGGSGSTDQCSVHPDPDPAIFIIDLQDANKKQIFLHITF